MQYRMRNDLSYCVVDGRAVFLDIAADRYFHLPGRLDQAFRDYANASDRSPRAVAMLVERNLLVPGLEEVRADPVPEVGIPLRSALEMPPCCTGSAVPALPEVLAITWHCRRRIQDWPLRAVVDEAARYRARRNPSPDATPDPLHERRLLHAVGAFHRARRFVPIGTRCLLDSLALSMFLSRRHLHARIVLGVAGDPFSAHCWVQAGDIVLNDNVGNAMAYTIIKVI